MKIMQCPKLAELCEKHGFGNVILALVDEVEAANAECGLGAGDTALRAIRIAGELLSYEESLQDDVNGPYQRGMLKVVDIAEEELGGKDYGEHPEWMSLHWIALQLMAPSSDKTHHLMGIIIDSWLRVEW